MTPATIHTLIIAYALFLAACLAVAVRVDMRLIQRLRVWWDDLSWMGEAEEFIDEFLDVYTASGGPKPMDKRRSGETMREYRARYVEWLTAPRVYPNWASDCPASTKQEPA